MVRLPRSATLSRQIPTAVLSILCAAFAARAAPPILTFDEVKPGMVGIGRTVFEGTAVEEFQVEVLGKLPDIGPDQSLILVRCSGGPLARTGVMAGMSGSPVYVDDKLIGAVAYSWGFASDAIAGVTPIEEMLAISSGTAAHRVQRTQPADPRAVHDMFELPERLSSFFDQQLTGLLSASGAALPMSVPLSVSGMSGWALEALEPQLRRAGFLPMVSGSSRGSSAPVPPLEPGSAMGIKLVRGDVEMTATGTVTWVDDQQLLGFGHPLFGLGRVDLPMTGGEVQALLPSLAQSAKFATPLAEIGALRQDRAAGVFGRLGAEPRMIPVRLQLTGASGGERAYSFDIADDPLLSPLLLYSTLTGILASKERPFGSSTVTLRRGSVIKMLGGDDVELDNLFAGNTAFTYGTAISAYILHLLMNNTWTQPQIAGVNLMLEFDDLPRSATIRRASLSRYHARPGETVLATVVIKPFRGPEQVLTREIVVPPDTPSGTMTLFVAGAVTASRAGGSQDNVLPQDLDQLVRLINQLRRNDRVYILASREDRGATLNGMWISGLPPSANRVLSRPREPGAIAGPQQRPVLEEAIFTDFAIEGSARLVLEIDAS